MDTAREGAGQEPSETATVAAAVAHCDKWLSGNIVVIDLCNDLALASTDNDVK